MAIKETLEDNRKPYLDYLGAHLIAKELDINVGIVEAVLSSKRDLVLTDGNFKLKYSSFLPKHMMMVIGVMAACISNGTSE